MGISLSNLGQARRVQGVFFNLNCYNFDNMIKQWMWGAIAGMALLSCGGNSSQSVAPSKPADSVVQQQRFFKVTEFLLGELAAVKQKGVTPLKTTVAGQKTDSAWLSLEQLAEAVGEFMRPVIDSTNLIGLFKESSFHDQTINAITFTHEPWERLPDSMALRRWDVHIDPDMGTVKRVYMVKTVRDSQQPKTLQLTWEAGKRCQMVTLNPAGDAIEKRVNILWDF
jgi:hypothetical protein